MVLLSGAVSVASLYYQSRGTTPRFPTVEDTQVSYSESAENNEIYELIGSLKGHEGRTVELHVTLKNARFYSGREDSFEDVFAYDVPHHSIFLGTTEDMNL